MQIRPLSKREQTVLDTLYAMHQEFPEAEAFEVKAVELITGPAAGSLGVLHSIGFIDRDRLPGEEWACRLTPRGWDAAEERRAMARRARMAFERRNGHG